MRRYQLGITTITFAPSDADAATAEARRLGFDHVDPFVDDDLTSLGLPVGCPFAYPGPRPGWCATPSPPSGEGRWEQAVQRFRAAPGCLLEPWAGGCVNSLDAMMAIRDEVPGLRFLVDTGHVADWGGDPCEVVEFASHVQLRQGCKGQTQLHVDDPSGVVDFARVLRRLDARDYRGRLTIEYFDLPDHGWALGEPVRWALDLARHVRSLPG